MLRLRDSTGTSREVAVAVSPAWVRDLVANEQFSITLEVLNDEGSSGETDAVIGWTNPPTPLTPAIVYVFTREDTVSIGWDLTGELASLRHLGGITVEYGRSHAGAPIGVLGSGKVRDLCLDLNAPVGILEYRLRLRGERSAPLPPAVSEWGVPVRVLKIPNAAARSVVDRSSRPLVGGQAFHALSLLLAEDEDDDDHGQSDGPSDDDQNDDNQGNDNSRDNQNESSGDAVTIASSSDDEASAEAVANARDGRPSDSDTIDPAQVHNYIEIHDPAEGGPIATIEVGGGYETRETGDGTWARPIIDRGGGWQSDGEWQFMGRSDQPDGPSSGAGRNDLTGSSRTMADEPEAARSRGPDGDLYDNLQAQAARPSDPPVGTKSDRAASAAPRPGQILSAEPSNPTASRPSNSAPGGGVSPTGDNRRSKVAKKTASASRGSNRARRDGQARSSDIFSAVENTLNRFLDRIRAEARGPTRPGRSGIRTHLSVGTRETQAAIRAAAAESGLSFDYLRAIASIESNMNPAIRNSAGYTGLFQFGRDAWIRYGEGDRTNARDNAMAAASMFNENARILRNHFGREPTLTELYIAHQQGPGFYTRNVWNPRAILGNRYPGMHGPQTRESFERGWGAEIERRMRYFESIDRGDQ